VLSHFVSLAALFAISTAVAEPVREEPPPAAASNFKPVTVAVVDRDTGAPITAFAYKARYDAPGHNNRGSGDVWTPVMSPAGTFEVQTPPGCMLSVAAKAPDFIGGLPLEHQFLIGSADSTRRIVIRLRRGITVSGIVRDLQTKQPVAGATVAPVALSRRPFPLPVRDQDKHVKTGVDGRYEVRGAAFELGVYASHPDFIDDASDPDFEAIGRHTHDIGLKRWVTISVTVRDADGKPLEGVTAGDTAGNPAISGNDGRLVVVPKHDPYDRTTFHKDGLIDRELGFDELHPEPPKADGIVVVMTRSIELTGRVVTPDGEPVAAFTVGAGPGKLPAWWDGCVREVRNNDGHFNLGLAKEGTTWVGVAAEGFAAWEGLVELKRGGKPLDVRLLEGARVIGTVAVAPELRKRIRAKLIPRRDKSDVGGMPAAPLAERLPAREASVSPDGTFRFEHVRPDRYRLIFRFDTITKAVFALDVPDAGVDLGTVPLEVTTVTGSVEGRVWRSKQQGGGVWAFTTGEVTPRQVNRHDWIDPWNDQTVSPPADAIEFRADENGRFRLDAIPVGLVTVAFLYTHADVVSVFRWKARVLEGRTTVVRAFDPEAHQELTLGFAIGDGSRAQYESGTGQTASRVDGTVKVSSRIDPQVENKVENPPEPVFCAALVPLSKGLIAFPQHDWLWLDAERRTVLFDVDPGTYRLLVYDWLGTRQFPWSPLDEREPENEPLFERDVVMAPQGGNQMQVALGAGCMKGSIARFSLQFPRPPVEVIAVPKRGRKYARRASCGFDGTFCVRYLSPGPHSLYIHDRSSGFCRIDQVEVPAGLVDIGRRTLTVGANVICAIQFPRLSQVPDQVVATGPSGVSVRHLFPVYASFDQVEFGNLWPGLWTLSVRSGNDVLATGSVDVHGTGTYRLALTAGGRQGP
jgi:hypothetical protein